MNRQTLVNGLLSLTVVSVLTGCVDDKYDLKNIDKTSRFTVNDLTVPVNLSEIKLKNVLDISDDDETIKKVEIDGKEYYAIKKSGQIETSDFTLNSVHVPSIPINPINISVQVPSVGFLPDQYINSDFDLSPQPLQDYHINLNNIDSSLKKLDRIRTEGKIKIDVVLSVPEAIVASSGKISFKKLKVKLPWGLLTDAEGYEPSDGNMTISEVNVDADGKAHFSILADGLDFDTNGVITDQTLDITDKVGIEGGQIHVEVQASSLPNPLNIKAEFSISAFDIASFSGLVEYKMNDVEIAPVSLSDLPDFLNSPETEIRIADPVILVDINNNPVGKYGLEGEGKLTLASHFSNNMTTEAFSDVFSITKEGAKIAFGSESEGYENVGMSNLGNILTNSHASGLPKSISVNIGDLIFFGEAVDFPVGSFGSAKGSYDLIAPLGFDSPSKIVYETTEMDWSNDDLDNLYVTSINLKANCSTDLPVSVQLSVVPVDKAGNEIGVMEESSNFKVPAMSQNQPVSLAIKGISGPIHGFDGVKFRAVITQDSDNINPIGPDQYINLSDLRVTVDGYFEKEL